MRFGTGISSRSDGRGQLRRWSRATLGSASVAVIAVLLCLIALPSLSFFSDMELKAYDFQFEQRPSRVLPRDVVFVGIDDTSIRDLGAGSYPLPRQSIANAVNFLHHAAARVIALDLVFASNTVQDPQLARAIQRAGNTVIASYLSFADASLFLNGETHLEEPVVGIRNAAAAVGLANVPEDADGAIRRMQLLQVGPGGKSFAGTAYPSFAAETAALALHRHVNSIAAALPSDPYINYVGPQNPGDAGQAAFITRQFESVSRGQDAPALYRNKIVIIGCAAVKCADTHLTPYGQMYGPLIQASSVYTILANDPIQPAGTLFNDVFVILAVIATSMACLRGAWWAGSVGALCLGAIFGAATIVFFQTIHLWVHLVQPLFAVVLTYAGIMAFRFATEERRRRYTNRIFGQYVKPEIVDMLVNATDADMGLAGSRRTLSVLFVDIRGFTAISEMLPPEHVVAMLDVYLEELTHSIQLYDGTLNKYVGDELVAMWNAPRLQPDHALLAVRAALDMINRMHVINDRLAERALPAVTFGIGVNTGEAVVGVMGSSFRKQYDVIGDTVNTCSRLCGAAAGGEALIGEDTWQRVGHLLRVEELEPVPLRGKRARMRTFRVMGLHGVQAETDAAFPTPA